jgi:sulfite exporter TauE/SafE
VFVPSNPAFHSSAQTIAHPFSVRLIFFFNSARLCSYALDARSLAGMAPALVASGLIRRNAELHTISFDHLSFLLLHMGLGHEVDLFSALMKTLAQHESFKMNFTPNGRATGCQL